MSGRGVFSRANSSLGSGGSGMVKEIDAACRRFLVRMQV